MVECKERRGGRWNVKKEEKGDRIWGSKGRNVGMSLTKLPEHPMEHLTESCLHACSACDLAWIFRQVAHTIDTVKSSV